MDAAKKTTEELLENIGVEAEVTAEDADGVLRVNIDSEESGLLIGYHGETLQSLQLLIRMMVNQGKDDWQQIIVDIGDYREQREEALSRMVSRAAQRARELGEDQELPMMSAYERRLVHMAISEEDDVVSESYGTGRDRRVVVKPDKSSLT